MVFLSDCILRVNFGNLQLGRVVSVTGTKTKVFTSIFPFSIAFFSFSFSAFSSWIRGLQIFRKDFYLHQFAHRQEQFLSNWFSPYYTDDWKPCHISLSSSPAPLQQTSSWRDVFPSMPSTSCLKPDYKSFKNAGNSKYKMWPNKLFTHGGMGWRSAAWWRKMKIERGGKRRMLGCRYRRDLKKMVGKDWISLSKFWQHPIVMEENQIYNFWIIIFWASMNTSKKLTESRTASIGWHSLCWGIRGAAFDVDEATSEV